MRLVVFYVLLCLLKNGMSVVDFVLCIGVLLCLVVVMWFNVMVRVVRVVKCVLMFRLLCVS